MIYNSDKPIDINDLYFGVTEWDFNARDFKEANLFNSTRVLLSVAIYRLMSEKERKELIDPLSFCFGDTWGRVEYEFSMDEAFGDGEHARKTDVYTVFVKPNRGYLLSLVDRIEPKSAKKYREDYYRPYREARKRAEAMKKAKKDAGEGFSSESGPLSEE